MRPFATIQYPATNYTSARNLALDNSREHVCKPGALPWSERKRPRGKRKTICTAGYAGPNPECDYSGNTDAAFHALVGCGRRGLDGIQQFKCQACQQRFTSRRGTALYRLRTPAAQVAQVWLAVNLGLSIADAALLFQHSEVTVRLWLTRAGRHAERMHAHFFRNLTLEHLQLEEQTPCQSTRRTPAMAASLTDHLWSVQEVLAFPVGL